MSQSMVYVALIVADYDEAIAYYTAVLGFDLIEDTPLHDGSGKRWVLVRPPGGAGTALLLARASTPAQEAAVGNQTGGRVFLFLHTDDFWDHYQQLRERGVLFEERPREEAYGTVAVFVDLYGNRWDLLQLRAEMSDETDSGRRATGNAMLPGLAETSFEQIEATLNEREAELTPEMTEPLREKIDKR